MACWMKAYVGDQAATRHRHVVAYNDHPATMGHSGIGALSSLRASASDAAREIKQYLDDDAAGLALSAANTHRSAPISGVVQSVRRESR